MPNNLNQKFVFWPRKLVENYSWSITLILATGSITSMALQLIICKSYLGIFLLSFFLYIYFAYIFTTDGYLTISHFCLKFSSILLKYVLSS